MGYRLRSIIYLHGYAVTEVSATFAAHLPPLRVVSSEQVLNKACSGQEWAIAFPKRSGVGRPPFWGFSPENLFRRISGMCWLALNVQSTHNRMQKRNFA